MWKCKCCQLEAKVVTHASDTCISYNVGYKLAPLALPHLKARSASAGQIDGSSCKERSFVKFETMIAMLTIENLD